MGTIVAIGLMILAMALFIAARMKWIHNDTIQLAANIATITALLAAVAIFLVPAPSSKSEQIPPPAIYTSNIMLTNTAAPLGEPVESEIVSTPTASTVQQTAMTSQARVTPFVLPTDTPISPTQTPLRPTNTSSNTPTRTPTLTKVSIPTTRPTVTPDLPKVFLVGKCDPETGSPHCDWNSAHHYDQFYEIISDLGVLLVYNSPGAEEHLDEYNVVIADFCGGAGNPVVVSSLKEYVSSGGTVIAMGSNACHIENYGTSAAASALTEDWGITFTSDDDSQQWADSISPHPMTVGVKRIYSQRHAYLNVRGPAQTVVSISGKPFIAVYEGQGIVIAISSGSFDAGVSDINEDYDTVIKSILQQRNESIAQSDNFVLWYNMLGWLSK